MKQYLDSHLSHCVLSLNESSFWNLNIDTVITSVIAGLLLFIPISYIVRNSSSGTFGYLQCGIELFYEWIESLVDKGLGVKDPDVWSVCFASLSWIGFMNILDILPLNGVNWIYNIFSGQTNQLISFKIVPTSDVNMCVALSLMALISLIYFGIKFKGGVFPYLKHWIGQPLGIKALPANVGLNFLEEVVSPLALGVRMFFNIFSGEILTIIISLSPFYLKIFLGSVWCIFHTSIILFQAYLFMSLLLTYIGESHKHSKAHKKQSITT